MTPAGEILREEIRARGAIGFRRFMEVALYQPEHGYYRRGRDPFGKGGDFYTAEQLQPVFGLMMAAMIEDLAGEERDVTVVELGSGRGEMREFFAKWRYVPVEAGGTGMPERFSGVVFANEFFDALPVDVVVARGGRYVERLVGWRGERFEWVDGGEVSGEIALHLERYGAPPEDGGVIEVNLDAGRAIADTGRRLQRGHLVAIDYGYTAREMSRFPAGTLMGYRKHQALDDVLAEPGERDITAHVNFTALAGEAARAGFDVAPLETMAALLLRIGERDQFAEVLRAGSEAEALRRRMQLKMLLYGMGETYRVLTARRG